MVESLRRFRDSLGEPVGNLHPARLTLPESEGTAPNGVVPPRQATGGLTPPASLESEGNGAKGKVHPPNAVLERPDDDPADDPEMFATVLAVLPTGRRDVVNRARCRTARELAAFGRTSLTALPGCGSNTCEHIEDWLSLHFGISLAR